MGRSIPVEIVVCTIKEEQDQEKIKKLMTNFEAVAKAHHDKFWLEYLEEKGYIKEKKKMSVK